MKYFLGILSHNFHLVSEIKKEKFPELILAANSQFTNKSAGFCSNVIEMDASVIQKFW